MQDNLVNLILFINLLGVIAFEDSFVKQRDSAGSPVGK